MNGFQKPYAWPSFETFSHVRIVDTTLRDGLQSPGVRQPALADKLELIELMARVGIDIVDIGFPESGESHFSECVQIARHIRDKGLPLGLTCLNRALPEAIEPVLRLADASGSRIDALIFTGTSGFRLAVEGWEVADVRSRISRSISLATRGGLEVTFGLEDGTRTEPELLNTFITTALEAGASAVCMADTVGVMTPAAVPALLGSLRGIVGEAIRIDWHGHNDRGLALANTLAAAQGVTTGLHATALGVGERAGNTPLEPLVLNLALEGESRFDLKALRDYSHVAARILGEPVPRSFPGIGADVHKTPSGIHASAMLKARQQGREDWAGTVYSAIDPRSLGLRPDVVVGPFSGKANVEWRLAELGISRDGFAVEEVLATAKHLNRELTDEDIRDILLDRGRPALPKAPFPPYTSAP